MIMNRIAVSPSPTGQRSPRAITPRTNGAAAIRHPGEKYFFGVTDLREPAALTAPATVEVKGLNYNANEQQDGIADFI
jgi:hypothetical protein